MWVWVETTGSVQDYVWGCEELHCKVRREQEVELAYLLGVVESMEGYV